MLRCIQKRISAHSKWKCHTSKVMAHHRGRRRVEFLASNGHPQLQTNPFSRPNGTSVFCDGPQHGSRVLCSLWVWYRYWFPVHVNWGVVAVRLTTVGYQAPERESLLGTDCDASRSFTTITRVFHQCVETFIQFPAAWSLCAHRHEQSIQLPPSTFPKPTPHPPTPVHHLTLRTPQSLRLRVPNRLLYTASNYDVHHSQCHRVQNTCWNSGCMSTGLATVPSTRRFCGRLTGAEIRRLTSRSDHRPSLTSRLVLLT